MNRLIYGTVTTKQGDAGTEAWKVTGPATMKEMEKSYVLIGSDVLDNILIELRVISHLLMDGLNLKDDIDGLREDFRLNENEGEM